MSARAAERLPYMMSSIFSQCQFVTLGTPFEWGTLAKCSPPPSQPIHSTAKSAFSIDIPQISPVRTISIIGVGMLVVVMMVVDKVLC